MDTSKLSNLSFGMLTLTLILNQLSEVDTGILKSVVVQLSKILLFFLISLLEQLIAVYLRI